MGSESITASWPAVKNWLDDTLRPFNFVTAMRERQHVKHTCQECLKLYRELASEHPNTAGLERYALVIARHTGADQAGIDTILQRVEESFAVWPIERPVNFRDVVQYLAITEYFNEHPSESGIHARVSTVVAELIPEAL